MTQGMNDDVQIERQRKQQLSNMVAMEVARGWRVESQTDTMAVVVRGKKPNHILHLLLTVFTLGLWLPVWLIVAMVSGEKRKTLSV